MKYLINSYKCSVDTVFHFLHDRISLLFVFSCFYVWSMIWLQPICFNENDSVGILRALESGLEAPFMSLLLGNSIGWLYTHVSSHIPWFPIVLYTSHVFSITFFLYALFSIKNIRYCSFPFVLIYLVLYSYFILRVGYNNSSIMIGANALFSFLIYLNINKKVSLSVIFLFGIGLSFSYLIRVSAIEAVFIFSFPVLLFELLSSFRRLRLAHYFLFATPLLLVVSTNTLIGKYFSSPEYQHYTEFNSVRGKLHGFPVLAENRDNAELLQQNNWSGTDYDALMGWLFLDEGKYNVQTLKRILDYPVNRKSLLMGWSPKLLNLIEKYKKHLPFLFFPLFLAIISSLPLYQMVPILFYQFYFIGGMAYMAVFYRFPARIGFPLIFLCATNSLYFILKAYVHKRGGLRRHQCLGQRGFWAFAASLVLLLWSANWLVSERVNVTNQSKIFLNNVRRINSLPSEVCVILEPATGVRFEYMDPLQTLNQVILRKIIPLGWAIFSPDFYNSLVMIGVEKGSQVLPEMLNNKDGVFIVKTSRFKKLIEQLAAEELGVHCYLKKMGDLLDGTAVYQLKSGSEPFPWIFFLHTIVRDKTLPWAGYISVTRDKAIFYWLKPAEKKAVSRNFSFGDRIRKDM